MERIVDRIEDFIKRKGINFYEIQNRHINSLDILLYCAYKLIKSTFKGYFYTIKEQKYIFTEMFMENFSKVIKGEIKLLNDINVITPSELFKIDRP